MAADIFKPPFCGITEFGYGCAAEFHDFCFVIFDENTP